MINAPLGLRDYLPHEIQHRDELIQKMADVALSNGYERIITPAIEHYDQLKPGLGDLSDTSIMFFDRTGSRLVLRPDHTTAIARIVSSRLSDELPVKLFYNDPVFRKDPLLGETEIFQFGVEHIGQFSIKDECEMVVLLTQMCESVGLDDYEIHVSHPDVFSNYSESELQGIKDGDFIALKNLPRKGGVDLAKDYDCLNQFFEYIESKNVANVFLNLGLYKDPNYYNGIYFELVSKSFGKVIASGGRYDSVLNAFGLDANAVGFAFRFHYLDRALTND
ncbi:MAG: ATP phosphoribosyltransferase regulatory subunit [Candidatus Margulisiibacteriota bacterium]|nr:ATP phosphoribosyltransferase regulatory subunit [Candidatus Margulisiibacteriota bacterium]